MKSILILMSTYNGSGKLNRQLDSILAQKNVEVHLLIRDDGSKDDTKRILNRYKDKYPEKISLTFGKNQGWKKSFMDLLYQTGDFDYYAFADQDDFWANDKLDFSIKELEKPEYVNDVSLMQTACIIADEKLNWSKEQMPLLKCPQHFEQVIAQEYFVGCCMVWNHETMKLILKYRPQNESLSHDYWVGNLCYLFGNVIFSQEKKTYHIRYLNNASNDGNRLAGKINRLKLFWKNNECIYMNPAKDLLSGYKEFMNKEQISFLNALDSYKINFISYAKIIFNMNFKRASFLSSFFFKFILFVRKF